MTVSVQFVGNATTVLRLGSFTLLTDPNFLHKGQWAYLGKGLVTRRLHEPALQVDELPPLDAVVLSHLHDDHFDRVARRGLDRGLPVFTTRAAARTLRRWGFAESQAMRTWQSEQLQRGGETLTVTSLPGVHAFGLLGKLLPPVMGTMLEYAAGPGVRPVRIYLSGDTLVHAELARIGQEFGEIDLAVVHLGGTKVLGAIVTMDGRQGVDLLHLLRPRRVLPVHFDDYGRFTSGLDDFRAELARRDPGSELHVLARGATLTLPAGAATPDGVPYRT